jgi:hypothetical protein
MIIFNASEKVAVRMPVRCVYRSGRQRIATKAENSQHNPSTNNAQGWRKTVMVDLEQPATLSHALLPAPSPPSKNSFSKEISTNLHVQRRPSSYSGGATLKPIASPVLSASSYVAAWWLAAGMGVASGMHAGLQQELLPSQTCCSLQSEERASGVLLACMHARRASSRYRKGLGLEAHAQEAG